MRFLSKKRQNSGPFHRENPKERGLVDPLKKKILKKEDGGSFEKENPKEGGWWIL